MREDGTGVLVKTAVVCSDGSSIPYRLNVAELDLADSLRFNVSFGSISQKECCSQPLFLGLWRSYQRSRVAPAIREGT